MRRLPPRVHVDDLRDPERWLRDHVYTSDETERAYEEQERTKPSRADFRAEVIGFIVWLVCMALMVGTLYFLTQ